MDVNFPYFCFQIFYAGSTGMGGVIVIIRKMSFLSNLQGACVENVHAVFLYLVIGDIGDIGDIKYIHVYVSLFLYVGIGLSYNCLIPKSLLYMVCLLFNINSLRLGDAYVCQ